LTDVGVRGPAAFWVRQEKPLAFRQNRGSPALQEYAVNVLNMVDAPVARLFTALVWLVMLPL